MKNYKITVQYDGSRYKGWQIQKSTDMTIQGKITNVLSSLVTHPVEVIGSGRTDAGVHATGQVANFHLDLAGHPAQPSYSGMTAQDIMEHLNHYLPDDIAVTKLEEVEDRFHSRYSCLEKTYRYRIHTSAVPNVFERKYVYRCPDAPLDVNKMREAAVHMTGERDYAAFCGNPKMKKSTIRNVTSIRIEEKQGEIVIEYTGNGFLQNMVRIMTGTLIEVGCGKKTPDMIPGILESKVREKAGYTVPSSGLVLVSVRYE